MLTRRGKKRLEISRSSSQAKRRRGSKDIRIYCRMTGHLNTKMSLIDISADDIDRLLKIKDLNPHNHSSSASASTSVKKNSFRFRTRELNPCSSLSTDSSHGPPVGNAAIIGSNLYVCYYCQILTSDLHNPSPQFRPIPNPDSYTYTDAYDIVGDDHMMPKLIALRGRLFFFSGNRNDAPLPFGEVYDPTTNLWSAIDPPKEADLTKCIVLFKASLGEATGKILFYVCDDKAKNLDSPCSIYIYHVDSHTWRTIPNEIDSSEPFDWNILGRTAVVNEDTCSTSTSLYWIDQFGTLCSFNWETLQLRKGQFVGLNEALWERLLEQEFTQMSLFHVSAHIFALAWNKSEGQGRAAYHITFFKMVEDDPYFGSVTGYTLGCFEHVYNGSLSLASDAVPF